MTINFPQGSKILFSCIVGSQLYGTSTPDSDVDVKGVFIPPKQYFMGFLDRIEQVQDNQTDTEYYDIRKFLKIALECNPTIIELLYAPEYMWKESSPEWLEIIDHRDYFLSKRARYSFTGYAMSQLKRIKRHRSWLLNPLTKKPERKDFGLPENQKLIPEEQIGAFNRLLLNHMEEVKQNHPLKKEIEDMLDTKGLISIIQSLKNPDINDMKQLVPASDNFIMALDREKKYSVAMREWGQYQNWKKNRNPKRAELEKQYGHDTKHSMHLLRLMTEGEELMKHKTITFPRPDKEFLLDIRNGKYSYDEIVEMADEFELKFNEYYNTSELPYKPNSKKINNLCIKLTDNYINNYGY